MHSMFATAVAYRCFASTVVGQQPPEQRMAREFHVLWSCASDGELRLLCWSQQWGRERRRLWKRQWIACPSLTSSE